MADKGRLYLLKTSICQNSLKKKKKRVVDTGDAAAMEALAKLKPRWEEKFGLVQNLRTERNFGHPTIKPRRCILEPVIETTRREGSTAMVTIDIPLVEKLQTMETEKTSDSGDKLAGSDGEDGCPGGVPSSDLAAVIEKQSEGMIQSVVIFGLEVSPENQTDVGICADVMHEVSNDVMDDVVDDVMDDVAADVTGDVSNNVEKISPTITQVHSFPMGLFVGNIPLNANSNIGADDKIADAFNNSSRRTLSYIPPTIQNGEVVVRPTMETIRNGSTKWKTTAVKATTNGFFFFQFKTAAYMEEAIEGGLWLFQGQPIVLQKWEPGMLMRKLKHTQVPVWIKLRHLSVELWTKEGLSTVASGIGKPLYPDAITRACTRLDFARVCVMLDVSSTLPKHIIIMTPDEEGGEIPRKIDVEYEWLPHKCTSCTTLGHSAKDCTLNKSSKPVKPPVSVYIPKMGPPRPPPLPPAREVENQRKNRESPIVATGPWHEERGKVIITYNAFDALNQLPDTERRELWNSMENIAMQYNDIPWLVGGDAVRDLSEICGAAGDTRMAMEKFNTCIQNTGLLPLPMQGEWYTWHSCNASPRNLWKRLDRMLINDRWMARFPTSYYSSLTPRTSDHSPMVICGDKQQQLRGTPMYAVTRKLKALKPVFREQRRKKGDLSHNVQLAKGFLEMAQVLVTSNRQDELFLQLEHCCGVVLAKAAKLEQIAQRRLARRILQINDDHGATHTDPGAVINEFVMYYQNLLGGERRRDMIDLRFLRPWPIHILSEDDVNSLVLPFTHTDVKQAIFHIAEDKAPGPDGYSSGFFKAAWPIVGQEVSSAVLDFFNTG
ncbi:UNVERIFIED_CONTAM: hypothetical protein Sindi_2018400 [Sesamum indicum]